MKIVETVTAQLANLGLTSKIWNHPYEGSLQELLPGFDETKRKQLMLQT